MRHARWGDLTAAGKAAGAAELQEIAAGRSDLLAEVAGLALGTSESRSRDHLAQGQAVAGLCIAAGAGESLIGPWVEEGRRRVAIRREPPVQ